MDAVTTCFERIYYDIVEGVHSIMTLSSAHGLTCVRARATANQQCGAAACPDGFIAKAGAEQIDCTGSVVAREQGGRWDYLNTPLGHIRVGWTLVVKYGLGLPCDFGDGDTVGADTDTCCTGEPSRTKSYQMVQV